MGKLVINPLKCMCKSTGLYCLQCGHTFRELIGALNGSLGRRYTRLYVYTSFCCSVLVPLERRIFPCRHTEGVPGTYSYTCHSIYIPWHPCRKSRQRFSKIFFLTYINKSCCKCIRKARLMSGYLLEFYYSLVMKQGALRLKNDKRRSGRFNILRIALFSCEIACSMNTSHASSLNPSASSSLSNVNES